MTDSQSLVAHIAGFARCRMLCVGDVMLDRYVHGDVSRISPEAPIPVFQVGEETAMLGGAGNVVRNAAALGVESCLIAVVGDDPVGNDLTAMVGDEPRIEPYLLVERGRTSTLKTRYIANAQQLLRADRETTAPVGTAITETAIRVAGDAIASCDVVVLSDYAKGMLSAPLIEAVIGAARAAGKPVVVDPKGDDFARYRGASVLTPNRRETAVATGLPTDSLDQVAAAGKAMVDRFGVGAAVITLGEDGVMVVDGDGVVEHLPAESRKVFDASGAGDTAAATLAIALGGGASLGDAARLANLAAGVVVGKVGTAVAGTDELLRAIHAGAWSSAEAKVASLSAALDVIGGWRRDGERIGFTNGCFDLLHPGHIALFDQTKAACDRLIVGLNDDASVRRIKGADRPIQAEASRAQMLASLGSVDLVVVFAEDTPMALIQAIRPDVLVKGADYRRDQVVGGDFVESYGGRVMLAELLDGHSTTETIAKLAR